MAKLLCKSHGKRVFVIENNSVPNLPYADVFHRNVSGNESVRCDSVYLTIDGDSYNPAELLDWLPPVKNREKWERETDSVLAEKADALIYS